MPGLGKYGTVEDHTSTSERRERFSRYFGESPLTDGSYNHDALIEIANELMLESDDPAIDFNYSESPSWDDVRETIEIDHGAHGGPTTPWTPNQVSPGAKYRFCNIFRAFLEIFIAYLQS